MSENFEETRRLCRTETDGDGADGIRADLDYLIAREAEACRQDAVDSGVAYEAACDAYYRALDVANAANDDRRHALAAYEIAHQAYVEAREAGRD